jgi:hypothetical protein
MVIVMLELLETRRMMSVVPISHSVPSGLIATVTPGTTVSLNPQPLPPGATSSLSQHNPGGPVELNPQPLPPSPPPEFSQILIV